MHCCVYFLQKVRRDACIHALPIDDAELQLRQLYSPNGHARSVRGADLRREVVELDVQHVKMSDTSALYEISNAVDEMHSHTRLLSMLRKHTYTAAQSDRHASVTAARTSGVK